MKTAEELTEITVELLGNHANEAALAVVLGMAWHLVWERPKHYRPTAVAKLQHDDSAPTQPFPETRTRKMQLRGNLKNELQNLLKENEELEKIVKELRTEIERNDRFPTRDTQYQHSSNEPIFYHPIGTRKRTRNPGVLRRTIGRTTNELDLLGSCWALLVFGYCLVSSRRRQKRNNPISETIELLEKWSLEANTFVQDDALPALSKIRAYFRTEVFDKLHARFLHLDSSTGKSIATLRETLRSKFDAYLKSIETVVYDQIIPVLVRLTKNGVEQTHAIVAIIAAIEVPAIKLPTTTLLWEAPPPTILLSEHDEKIRLLEESVAKEVSKVDNLQGSLEGLQMALLGKESLLYEERMKTRTAKLAAAKVALEREETRREETRSTREAALEAISDDQKRLLRNFLTEHVSSKQQKERLRKIDEKNAPKKSTIVLPDPILQGFASAMYINNVSDLSSIEYNTNSSLEWQKHQHLQHRQQHRDFPTDHRDDVDDDDDYYGNPNETRLQEIKEQFLRSKTMANSLRPSLQQHTTNESNQASTGSLLWNAANPATKDSGTTKKHLQQYHKNDTSLVSRKAVASQRPSSWMDDPASIMCDWRTHGNEEDARE